MKIRTKLVLAFLGVGITPLIILSFLSIRTTAIELENQTFNMVSTVSDHKRSAIENYFATCESQAMTLSNSKLVVDSLYALDEFHHNLREDNNYTPEKVEEMRKHVKSFYFNQFAPNYKEINEKSTDVTGLLEALDDISLVMQYHYISNNPFPLGYKNKLNHAGDDSDFSAFHEEIHPQIRQYLDQFGYYDLILTCPEGRVVYSSSKEVDFGALLLDGLYQGSNLADVVGKALNAGRSGDRDSVFMVDFQAYKPSYDQPSSFLASPVVQNGKCIGTVVLKLSLERLTEVMVNNSGLGETGDSYLIGPDYRLRSDSHKVKDMTVAESFQENNLVKNDLVEKVLAGESILKLSKNLSGKLSLVSGIPVYVGGYTWALIDEIELSEAISFVNHLKWSLSILSGISALVVIVVSLFICSSLIRPIRKMSEGLKGISTGEGNLTKRLTIKNKDEIGEASEAFNSFMSKLNSIIVGLAQYSKKLGIASGKLENSATEMANNSTGMDNQITSVAAAGDQLSVNIQSMSQGADQISMSAREVSQSVTDLRSSMEDVAKNCNRGAEIAQDANVKTQRTSNDIHDLGKVAQEIEGVVDLIRSVAEQTNLLALNASIEAASAGEAGQGFAVVANEVKELAKQTTDATREIEGKISQIRERIEVSVDSITEVSKVIQNVKTISVSISQTMDQQSITTNEISKAVKEVSDSSVVLAKNVEESAGGANEIAKNISGVSEAAKVSKDVANDANEQSKDLALTANKLNDIVDQFKY